MFRYHGWTYNLKGDLIKATQLKGIENFKNKDYGLLRIPDHSLFENLIFLDFSGNSTQSPFEQMKHSATKHSRENGFDNAGMLHIYSRKYLLQCNWKVFVENYLDGGYHVPHLHLGLNSNLDPKSYRTVIEDYASFQSVQSNQAGDDSANQGYAFL